MKLSDTKLWDKILFAVDEGHVVPIVGPDLLLVDTPAGPRPFHRVVAAQLAEDLEIPLDQLPPDFETNDVICASKEFRGDPSKLSSDVNQMAKMMQEKLKAFTPEPLRLLASIPKFKLYVSTTIDTLLAETIASIDGRKPVVLTFPPSSAVLDYLPEHRNGSFVFQMLGGVSSTSPGAVTEGQVLERMHGFMAGTNRPVELIAELQRSHLLILGVSFPDWLARFLLRLTRDKPLWDSRPFTELFADSRTSQAGFAEFLHHFSPQQSQVLEDGTAVDFVRELHRRWFERYPAGGEEDARALAGLAAPAPYRSGSVFISYASEDREATFRLADILTSRGLEVWVDRRINPGDGFRSQIERNIRDCCAFVAVLSQHTQAEDGRWFRREWDQACDKNRDYFGTDRRFLFPVVVDSTPSAEMIEFKRDIFRTSAVRALGGTPPDELVTQLDLAQKVSRKQYARA